MLKSENEIEVSPEMAPENCPQVEAESTTETIGVDEAANIQNEVLVELLSKIKKVDFHKIAKVEEGEELKSSHILIIAVEQILKAATDNEYGLCMNQGFIYLYNGKYWKVLQIDELKTFLGLAAQKIGVPWGNSKLHSYRDQLVKQFYATAHLPLPEIEDEFVKINLKNGTFEIGESRTILRDFNPADFLTYQLPFDFDESGAAPLFTDYLNKVLPERELQNILAEYLGYIFTKLKLEKTLLLYGSGANGKSVFFDIVKALLGSENVSGFSLTSLTDNSGYYRASIANKLVNYASEISGKMQSSFFKQLVSGEPIEARLPYGRPQTIEKYAKFIFNCNELPNDVEFTNAFFRRFLIIPFEVTIPQGEQDSELSKRIIANELSGIFNWVLEGLGRLIEQKRFTASEIVDNVVNEYRIDSDSVKSFLKYENYVASVDHYSTLQDFYNEYRAYCIRDGHNPVNKKEFNKRLQNEKIPVERKREGYRIYISQRQEN